MNPLETSIKRAHDEALWSLIVDDRGNPTITMNLSQWDGTLPPVRPVPQTPAPLVMVGQGSYRRTWPNP